MTTRASIQDKNQESSIQFMQQEHATTLQALHNEVNKLQSRCTDLTFQLTMNGVNIEEEGDGDSRIKEMNTKLQASQTQGTLLQSQISEQDHKLQRVEQELRVQKKRQLDETRNTAQTINSLKGEVEAKASNISYLTAQLHRLKLKQQAEPQAVGAEATGAQNALRSQTQNNRLPVPPRDMLTNSARMRQQRSHVTTHSGVRRVSSLASSPATGISSRVASASGTLDISPFVQRDVDLTVSAMEVKKPAPLPPIAGSRMKERELHRVIISKQGQLTRPSMPEVATLAVDQINDSTWKRLPQSHSCEYK